MSTGWKRITITPDPADCERVVKTAPLSESSVEEFAARSVPDRARTVLREKSATAGAAELSQEDLALVERFLDEHPGWIEEHVRRAREDTADIPFREPSPDERL